MDAQHYAEIYKELAGLIGENNTRKIWQQYHGQAVQFPQRLYSREYTHAFIRENEGIIKPREMAQTLGLTERRVRQIIQKMREEEEGKGRQEPAE